MAERCTKMADCNICCETFNATTRKAVLCGYCNFEACRACVCRYLCSSTETPHCMQCRNGWNNEFMSAAMTKSFLTKEYKLHREKVLYERECSMLPETQPLAEAEAKRRIAYAELRDLQGQANTIKYNMTRLRTKRTNITNAIMQLNPYITTKDINRIGYNDLAPINRELNNATLALYKLNQQISPLRNIVYNHNRVTATIPKREFVRRCPKEECRGFLDGKWCCGLCDTEVCSQCHEPFGTSKEEHTCSPDNLQTAKALDRETRPCPKCSTRIFKLGGCDQMWCTQCRTAFSWRSGQVATGPIHNPHYIEFLRRNNGGADNMPRDPLDIPCGGLPHAHFFSLLLSDVIGKNDVYEFLMQCLMMARHVEYAEFPRYRTQDVAIDNQDLRIAFLLKDFDADALKTKLQRREKAVNRKREIMDVLTMMVNVTAIVMQRIEQGAERDAVEAAATELQALLEYTDESMKKISERYNCVTPRFTESDRVLTVR